MSCRLLLIEDGLRVPRVMTDFLRDQGYTLDTVSNGDFAAEIGLADTFDLIIVDAASHTEPSLEICAELRRRGIQTPILVLSGCTELAIKVAAFNAGADDYVTTPVDPSELHVRIEALLRRAAQNGTSRISRYEFGGMLADFTKSTIVCRGVDIGLSEREGRLLQYFVENRGKTISRDTLLRRVWGYQQAPLTRTVDVHILRLRQKVEKDPKNPQFIVTVPGLGYRFDG